MRQTLTICIHISLRLLHCQKDDCSVEVSENLNMIPPALKAVGFVMFGINVLVSLVCGLWIIWKRESPQVRRSQPFFLLLVLVGCLISTSTILAMAQEDEGDGPVLACSFIPWLYSVGFSVTFGTLFGKIRRVYKIFTQEYAAQYVSDSIRSGSTSSRRDPLTVKDALFFVGSVLVIDIIILILWTTIDPLEWKRKVILEDKFGYPLSSEGYCTSSSWKIFSSIIGALHVGLLVVACYMCYAARNIPTKYSEHKYVSIAMLSNLQIFVVGGECD